MFKSEMITPISHEEIQQKGVEELKQNSWNDIPNEEFFKKSESRSKGEIYIWRDYRIYSI